MKNERIQRILADANNEYRIVKNELFRPAEDIVQMAVCLGAKEVLSNYLKAYLLFNNVEVTDDMSILQLLKECKTVGNDFMNINLSHVICQAETGEVKEMYCLSSLQTKKCFEAAQSVRELVMEKIMKK